MIPNFHKTKNNRFQIRGCMNDTQSGKVSGRGCQVSLGGRSASSSGRHLRQTLNPRRPLSRCSGDGRLFQGGVVRISWLLKNVYIASPLISNRPLFPVSKMCSYAAFSVTWLGFAEEVVLAVKVCVLRQRGKCSQWKTAGRQPEPEHQRVCNRFALMDQTAGHLVTAKEMDNVRWINAEFNLSGESTSVCQLLN